MPIYEYEREDGSVFETFQGINDDTLEVCPDTGQKVRRIMSQNAFHLKGTGWYKTDYSSNGSSPSTSSSSEPNAEKKEDKKEDKKVEKKAEAKSESKPSTD